MKQSRGAILSVNWYKFLVLTAEVDPFYIYL